jgi:glycosyltransferase involved in cell wall biosynthesis
MAIDAARVTGPAKGILQLCAAAAGRFVPRLVLFGRAQARSTELRDACAAQGLDVAVLAERHRFDPALAIELARLARRWHADVLQTHGYKASVLAWLLRRPLGIPWLAFSHGPTTEDLKTRLYHRLDGRVLGAADRVVAVSGTMRQALAARGIRSERLVTVPNAVDLPPAPDDAAVAAARRMLGVDADRPVAVAVGRLSPEKGHAVLLDAMSAVLAAVPRALVLLVGDGPEDERLRASARPLGDAVRFLGYRRDVAGVYAAADALVLPSLSEGLPNAALEAMAYGRPVVASAVGGVPEVVLDGVTGRLVPAGDPAALARALAGVLSDRDARASWGTAGRDRIARHFSPQARGERLLRLYAELLAVRARRDSIPAPA